MTYDCQFNYRGSTVSLECERRELAQALSFIYRPFLTSSPPTVVNLVDADLSGLWNGRVDGEDFSFKSLLYAVVLVEDTIADRLMRPQEFEVQIHASGARDDKNCYFLIGVSGSGKSTTALEMTRRGFSYLGDEFLNIKDGMVYPFPRAAIQKFDGPKPKGARLMIPSESHYRDYCLPENLSDLAPFPLEHYKLVFPRLANDEQAQVHRLSTGDACAKLMRSVFGIEEQLRDMWPLVAKVASNADSFEFIINDVNVDLELLTDAFG